MIIEQFGYGIKIEHHGSRPVILKDGAYTYSSFPGAGHLYFEDVLLVGSTTFQAGQKVWAWQLDIEVPGPKLLNFGQLWIMGLKTENNGTVIATGAGGETELLGGLLYPAVQVPITDVAFVSEDAQVSYVYAQSSYCATCGYTTPIAETFDGIPYTLTAKALAHYVMPLFVGVD